MLNNIGFIGLEIFWFVRIGRYGGVMFNDSMLRLGRSRVGLSPVSATPHDNLFRVKGKPHPA